MLNVEILKFCQKNINHSAEAHKLDVILEKEMPKLMKYADVIDNTGNTKMIYGYHRVAGKIVNALNEFYDFIIESIKNFAPEFEGNASLVCLNYIELVYKLNPEYKKYLSELI